MWAKIRAKRVSPHVRVPARAAGELDFFVMRVLYRSQIIR